MISDFVALDIETSNSDRSSICEIGIVIYKDFKIVEEYHSLINPLSVFLDRNISVHGITPEDVQDSPNFREVYPKIEAICKNSIVVHHGAFDWQSLCHAAHVEKFNLPICKWFDTRKASKIVWPEMYNHKLNTICNYLNISLDHHKALSDAKACGEIFKHIIKNEFTPKNLLITVDKSNVSNYTLRFPKEGS